METTTQNDSHSKLTIRLPNGVTILSSDPEEQKVINEEFNKMVTDTFNTLSPQEQEEVKEIEKVINEGWEIKEKLSDPHLQKLCEATCRLAKQYRLAKIYQHTSDGKDLLDWFKANCCTGGYYRILVLMEKQLTTIYNGLEQGMSKVPLPEEENALLDFFSKVNEWGA